MLIKCFTVGSFETNCYIVTDEQSLRCAVIDPGADATTILNYLEENRLRCAFVLLTHGHFDHTLAAGPLSDAFGIPVFIHPLDLTMLGDAARNAYDPAAASLPSPDAEAKPYPAEDGQNFEACGIPFTLLHTPGHTPGSVCLYAPEWGVLFSGDTLFAGGYGRMDLPGGSPEAMRRSLLRLLALPEDTRVLPGHMGETTIRRERRFYGV